MKKNIVRIVSFVLTALLFMSIAAPVGAAPFTKKDTFSLVQEDQKNGVYSLISSDGALVINVTKQTPIFLEDGRQVDYKPDKDHSLGKYLSEHTLTVTYSTTTKGLPPQTTPDKIVVHAGKPQQDKPQQTKPPQSSTKKDRFILTDLDTKTGTFTMLSADGQLQITIDVNTTIRTENGKSLFEETGGGTVMEYLNNKTLTVTYGAATKSIPAKTRAEYILVHTDKAQSQNQIKKDRFTVTQQDKRKGTFSMISADGKLALNIDKNTRIMLENGQSVYDQVKKGKIAEYLNDKQLTVIYSVTTRSMPPQTSPDLILVHEDTAQQAKTKKARFNLQKVDQKKGTFSMISADKKLVINVSKDTPIYLENGQAIHPFGIKTDVLAKFLNKQKLTVSYSATTKSNPPQTSPIKIVINGKGFDLLAPFIGD